MYIDVYNQVYRYIYRSYKYIYLSAFPISSSLSVASCYNLSQCQLLITYSNGMFTAHMIGLGGTNKKIKKKTSEQQEKKQKEQTNLKKKEKKEKDNQPLSVKILLFFPFHLFYVKKLPQRQPPSRRLLSKTLICYYNCQFILADLFLNIYFYSLGPEVEIYSVDMFKLFLYLCSFVRVCTSTRVLLLLLNENYFDQRFLRILKTLG